MSFDSKNIRRRLKAMQRNCVEDEDAIRLYGAGVQQTLAAQLQPLTDGKDFNPAAELSQRIWGVPLAEAERRYETWCRAVTSHVRIEIGEEAFSMLEAKIVEVDLP